MTCAVLLSLRNSLGLRNYVIRQIYLLQIDGFEVKRRATAQKIRCVSLSQLLVVTPSRAGNHTGLVLTQLIC